MKEHRSSVSRVPDGRGFESHIVTHKQDACFRCDMTEKLFTWA